MTVIQHKYKEKINHKLSLISLDLFFKYSVDSNNKIFVVFVLVFSWVMLNSRIFLDQKLSLDQVNDKRKSQISCCLQASFL